MARKGEDGDGGIGGTGKGVWTRGAVWCCDIKGRVGEDRAGVERRGPSGFGFGFGFGLECVGGIEVLVSSLGTSAMVGVRAGVLVLRLQKRLPIGVFCPPGRSTW